MKSKEEIKLMGEKYAITHEDVSDRLGKYLVSACFQDGYIQCQCQEDMAKESIAFAEFLKADFEMEDSGSSDDILWLLCGTRQTYTTVEIYDEFIKSRSLINSLNKQD
jgi:hypothetical protein